MKAAHSSAFMKGVRVEKESLYYLAMKYDDKQIN